MKFLRIMIKKKRAKRASTFKLNLSEEEAYTEMEYLFSIFSKVKLEPNSLNHRKYENCYRLFEFKMKNLHIYIK